ncbi:hypothetical protein JQC91_05135 [Jannaschia sp. Os4]|uniref:hypothetical protein n=1 Tax=Jannaschia sp. Os4 TaxID=2807617 RepID=UPI00193988D2|nr:hypothetical protein [Jannaschia sp. Os4]MBM2575683.1 hypothetical protein [Jannaschia sp. Os4]
MDDALDAASFHLARGFLREADSLLAAVPPPSTPRARARLRRLTALTAVARGTTPERTPEPLALAGWQEDAFVAPFRAVGAVGADLDVAIRSLHRLPAPLRSLVADRLGRLAVQRGADAALEALADLPGNAHMRDLLRARRGEVAGPSGPTAVRSWWAHRTRLEEIDAAFRARREDAESTLAALRMLHASWRDEEETTRRIAALSLRTGRPIAAIRALVALDGRGPADHPSSAARISRIAMTFYASAEAGRTDLPTVVDGHERILALARFIPGYADAWTRYVDFLERSGAGYAASEERRDLDETIRIGHELGLWNSSPARRPGAEGAGADGAAAMDRTPLVPDPYEPSQHGSLGLGTVRDALARSVPEPDE